MRNARRDLDRKRLSDIHERNPGEENPGKVEMQRTGKDGAGAAAWVGRGSPDTVLWQGREWERAGLENGTGYGPAEASFCTCRGASRWALALNPLISPGQWATKAVAANPGSLH